MEDLYRNLGPLQWDGPGADSKALTLCVEDQDYMGLIKKRQEYLDKDWRILESMFAYPKPSIFIFTLDWKEPLARICSQL